MPTTAEPPSSPELRTVSPTTESNYEAIRRQNLKTEGNIRTVGACIAVVGTISLVFALISIVFGLISGFKGGADATSKAFADVAAMAIVALLPVAYIATGNGLEKLKPGARLAGVIICCLICFTVFPFGLTLGVAGIVILCGKRARTILSAEYRETLSKTPEINSHRSWIIPAVYGMICFLYAVVSGILRIGGGNSGG